MHVLIPSPAYHLPRWAKAFEATVEANKAAGKSQSSTQLIPQSPHMVGLGTKGLKAFMGRAEVFHVRQCRPLLHTRYACAWC